MTQRKTFEAELKDLSNSIVEMCEIVEKAYERLFLATEMKDANAVEEVLKNDRKVNDMERQIEAKCLTLITKQHPIASDLRFVSAALKVVTDIERVGDNVADMAELILRLNFKDLSAISPNLPKMIEETKVMIRDAVHAFINGDSKAAKEVIDRDDIIDEYFNKVKNDVINGLIGNQNPDECIDILMMSKYLEKIGDHGVTIGQWQIFKETGNIRDFRIL